MNQMFCMKLEKEVNGHVCSLVFPVGIQWAEAEAVAQEFAAAVSQLAQDAQKAAAQQAADQNPETVEAEPAQEA